MKILGISGGMHFDPGACLIVDGQVVALAREEWFLHRRHAFDLLPWSAAAFCLARGGLEFAELDHVAVSWDPRLLTDPGVLEDYQDIHKIFHREIFHYWKPPAVDFLPHHVAHLAGSYFLTGEENAAYMVIDSKSETSSMLSGRILEGNFVRCDQHYFSYSLDALLDAAIFHLGLTDLEYNRLIELAQFGQPRDCCGELRVTSDCADMPALDLVSRHHQEVEKWVRVLIRHFGAPVKRETAFHPETNKLKHELLFEKRHFDLAATVQNQFKSILPDLLKASGVTPANSGKAGLENGEQGGNPSVKEEPAGMIPVRGEPAGSISGKVEPAGGISSKGEPAGSISGKGELLILGGGIVTNPAIVRALDELGQRYWVPPCSGDDLTAFGAAAFLYNRLTGERVRFAADFAWGPGLEIVTSCQVLESYGLAYQRMERDVEPLVDLLVHDQLVGIAEGRAEITDRIFHSRCILAARTLDAGQRLLRMKEAFRWRTLAYLVANQDGSLEMRYDGLADKQVLLEKRHGLQDTLVYQICRSYQERTGDNLYCSSLNQQNQPLAVSIQDILKFWITSDLDALVLNDLLLKKPGCPAE